VFAVSPLRRSAAPSSAFRAWHPSPWRRLVAGGRPRVICLWARSETSKLDGHNLHPQCRRARWPVVINFDPPADDKAYVHRVGRTARAGPTGVGVTFMTGDQQPDMARSGKVLDLEREFTAACPPARPRPGRARRRPGRRARA